jgi:hypothetical protein
VATASAFTAVAPDPAASQARARESRAQAFLLRLTRAVQRAAIYPAGHPAVAQGVGPLLDALRALVADGPLTVAVGRTRLLVSGGDRPPTEHELPWLAARLFDRQIAAFTIDPQLDATALARLVAWLSSADAGADVLPDLAGIALSRFDGRHLRFRARDGADAPAAPAETVVAWHALTASLREAYGSSGDEADSPAALSARIRQVLHAAEGTGVADLAARLVRVHAGAAPLDADAKAAVIVRLAALVNGLSPELRGSLLATHSADEAGKLALVEDLLPHMPPSVLADIAAGVTIDAAPAPPAFVRFLKKLSQLSADHPIAREALGARLGMSTLPAALDADDLDAGPGRTTAASIDADLVVPTKYRARLEQLANEPVGSSARPRADASLVDPPALDAHLMRIALLQARRHLPGPGAEPYLRCVLDVLPRERARRSMPTLMEAADLVIRLRAAREALTPDGRDLLDRCERAFSGPDAIAPAIDAVVAAPIETGGLSSALLLAGGAGAAHAALAWLRTAPAGEPRLRVAAVVTLFDAEIARVVVAPALSGDDAAADALAAVLDRIDPARAIELAMGLMGHDRAEIRRRATTWLLGASLSAARLQRVLQQALEDREPAIVAAALDAADRLDGRTFLDPLAAFAVRRLPAPLVPAQLRAMAMLAARADGAARLAAVLARRGYLCHAADRRVSLAIASALSLAAASGTRHAIRAWRWTPAGLLSLFSRPLEGPRP